jgi:hypothetical protein
MLINGSVILSEAKDPMYARGASGNAMYSSDAEDLAANLLNNLA